MFRSRAPILLAEKEVRERRRITQTEIALSTGIRQPTISAWMNYGVFSRLESNVVEALIKYFDCTLSDLVEFVPDEEEAASGEMVAVGVA